MNDCILQLIAAFHFRKDCTVLESITAGCWNDKGLLFGDVAKMLLDLVKFSNSEGLSKIKDFSQAKDAI